MHTKKSENEYKIPTFWTWFLKGTNDKPGYKKFFNLWLILHLIIGILLSYILPKSLAEIAVTLLLPAAGIFIGLSFAWGGNAQALLQTSEIEVISKYKKGGFEDYVFTFQSAILFILITLILWTIAGIGLFDEFWPKNSTSCSYYIVSTFLFSISSLTLRECWHVVFGAQQLLLLRHEIRKRNTDQ